MISFLKKFWWVFLAILSAIAGIVLTRKPPVDPSQELDRETKDKEKDIEKNIDKLRDDPDALLDAFGKSRRNNRPT